MRMMKLNSSLFNIPIVNNVLFYDTITSTNDKAKELARRGSVHGSLVVAKSQTAGKGRLGRSFDSRTDDGLYMSLMVRPSVNPEHLSGITLVVALAVSKAIDSFCGVKTSIKWPNDIYVNGKKLVGILTEAGAGYVVLGIGINVNTKSFNKDISDNATSLFLETHNEYDKAGLLREILIQLNTLYDLFVAADSLEFILEDYNKRLGSLNKEVYIIPQQRSLDSSNPSKLDTTGLTPQTCLGIDREGNLVCRDKDGTIHYVNSGEVSLRTL